MGAFTGKVARVTGAARGLGRVCALALALEVARHNISVNALATCAIDAPGDMIWQYLEKEQVPVEQLLARIPIGQGRGAGGHRAVPVLGERAVYYRPDLGPGWRVYRAVGKWPEIG